MTDGQSRNPVHTCLQRSSIMKSGRECIAANLFSEPFDVTAESGKYKGRLVKRSLCQNNGCRYKQDKRQCRGYIEVDAKMKDSKKTLMKYIKDHAAGHEEQVRKDAVAGAPTPPLSVVAVPVGVPIKEAPPPPSVASVDAEIHEKQRTPEEEEDESIESYRKAYLDQYNSSRTFLEESWRRLDDNMLKDYLLFESCQIYGPRLFPKMDRIGPMSTITNERRLYYCVLSNKCGDSYGIWLPTVILYAIPEYITCAQQLHKEGKEGKKSIEFRDKPSVDEVDENAAGLDQADDTFY